MLVKKIMAITVILVIIVISRPLFIYYSRDLPRSDPISKLIFPDDTIYAPRFSESRFLKVQIGMNVTEVINLLGDPLEIFEYAGRTEMRQLVIEDNGYRVDYQSDGFDVVKLDKLVYIYSKFGPKHDHFHDRAFTISRKGLVTEIHRSFYVD